MKIGDRVKITLAANDGHFTRKLFLLLQDNTGTIVAHQPIQPCIDEKDEHGKGIKWQHGNDTEHWQVKVDSRDYYDMKLIETRLTWGLEPHVLEVIA